MILASVYESTMLFAVFRPSNFVLNRGAAFGIDDAWMRDAMRRTLLIVQHAGMDVGWSATATAMLEPKHRCPV